MKDYSETSSECVAHALATLDWWLSHKPSDPRVQSFLQSVRKNAYPQFRAEYDPRFQVSNAYRDTLPDIQNADPASIRGARTQIQSVGIADFRLPLTYMTRDGHEMSLETSVTGSVSLDMDKRGINMSRIMRTFYRFAATPMDFMTLSDAAEAYRKDLDSEDAKLQLLYAYPLTKRSLRSGLDGYQYYDVAMDVEHRSGVRIHVMHLRYTYSSTCPCSLELSEHARRERGQLATPHSQRSFADLSVEIVDSNRRFLVEDLIDCCRNAIPTETQVMVKREDEQAFAELNAANPIFVEDAVRRIWRELEKDDRIGDFRISASHEESLHSHNAVSTLHRGGMFSSDRYTPFRSRQI